jgi:glycosyltransferase involved in cell wall biosynthesis
MKMAYVCADPGVPVFGPKGCSVHVQAVAGALRAAGVELDLFAARPGGPPPPSLAGLPLRSLPCPDAAESAARERAAFAANGALRAALEACGPFDAVYERYSLWSFAGMEYARDAGAAGLLEVNAPLAEEQAEHRELVHRDLAEGVADRAFAAASRLIAVSEPLARWAKRRTGARGRVEVVPNAIDPARFPPKVDPTLRAEGVFTVGFLGSLKPWHGLSILAEAFARLHRHFPASRLLVVGDGPERPAFEDELVRHGVRPRTELTGAVAPHEVPGLLASMDAAVAPYPPQPRFYFSPLKLYEYMAAGLPVVASRIGQVAEAIRHGEDGLLCTPGDADGIAEALGRLAAAPALRARLGAKARRRVLAERTWSAVAERILLLAAESLRERRSGIAVEVGRA